MELVKMGRWAGVDKATKKVVNVIIWNGESEVRGLTDNDNVILVEADSEGDIDEYWDEGERRFKRPVTIVDRETGEVVGKLKVVVRRDWNRLPEVAYEHMSEKAKQKIGDVSNREKFFEKFEVREFEE